MNIACGGDKQSPFPSLGLCRCTYASLRGLLHDSQYPSKSSARTRCDHSRQLPGSPERYSTVWYPIQLHSPNDVHPDRRGKRRERKRKRRRKSRIGSTQLPTPRSRPNPKQSRLNTAEAANDLTDPQNAVKVLICDDEEGKIHSACFARDCGAH